MFKCDKKIELLKYVDYGYKMFVQSHTHTFFGALLFVC